MPEVLHLVGEVFDTLSKFDTVFMHNQCIKIQLASCQSSAAHPSNNIINNYECMSQGSGYKTMLAT